MTGVVGVGVGVEMVVIGRGLGLDLVGCLVLAFKGFL